MLILHVAAGTPFFTKKMSYVSSKQIMHRIVSFWDRAWKNTQIAIHKKLISP